MVYLTTRWFGVFLHDGKNIMEKRLFPKDSNEISHRLYKILNDEVLDEEMEFKKFQPVVGEKRLGKIGKTGDYKKLNIKAHEYGYTLDLLIESCIKTAERKIKEEESKRENRISQAVNALDEIIKMENILMERISEWHSFFGEYGAKKIKIGNEKLDIMEEKIIKKLADILDSLHDIKDMTENYLEEAMKEIAPNTTKIAGYKIASRLITAAGGIKKLASMPSGTIQLLGAEKALFRHLKEGSQPPKHGYLFLHEMVRKAPRDRRGKIARLLATKIAMAAKADAFTGRDIADKLLDDIKERYNKIVE